MIVAPEPGIRGFRCDTAREFLPHCVFALLKPIGENEDGLYTVVHSHFESTYYRLSPVSSFSEAELVFFQCSILGARIGGIVSILLSVHQPFSVALVTC